jgi:outer membrane protein assembly factor BamB
MQRAQLTTDDLLFVGFSGRVFAVHRATGEVLWRWDASKGGRASVMILPDRDRVFVCVQGYTWALDPTSGRELWFQPFKGEGTGIPMLATMRASAGGQVANAAAAAAQQAAVMASVAAAAAAASAAS